MPCPVNVECQCRMPILNVNVECPRPACQVRMIWVKNQHARAQHWLMHAQPQAQHWIMLAQAQAQAQLQRKRRPVRVVSCWIRVVPCHGRSVSSRTRVVLCQIRPACMPGGPCRVTWRRVSVSVPCRRHPAVFKPYGGERRRLPY